MLKQTIGRASIFFVFLTLSPQEIDTTSHIYYNRDKAPFTTLINWENDEQRKNYDTILRAKYDIYEYEIHYMDSLSAEIPSPGYEKEKIQIIYDTTANHVLGYIWAMENITLPILVYKPNPGFLEDPFVYSQLHAYESIHMFNTDEHISLASFEALSLNDWKRVVLENVGRPAKKYRGLVNKKVYREYLYAPSTLKMITYAENNLLQTFASWKAQNPNKTIWIYLTKKRQQEYTEIAEMIKQDTKKYAGKKWKKSWEDILEFWPMLKSLIQNLDEGLLLCTKIYVLALINPLFLNK